MRKSLYLITLLLIIGCAAEAIYVFENVPSSVDDTYGYTPENPIQVGYWGFEKSERAGIFFISRLATEDDQRLEYYMHATMRNPLHEADVKVPWYLRYNRYSPYQGIDYVGFVLDAHILITETSHDTLTIYIDTYRPGPIMAPRGLKFVYPSDE